MKKVLLLFLTLLASISMFASIPKTCYIATTRPTGFGTFLCATPSGALSRTDNPNSYAQWTVTQNTDGSYCIKNNATGKYLNGTSLYSYEKKVYLFSNEHAGGHGFGISTENNSNSSSFLNCYTYSNGLTSYSNDDGSNWIFASSPNDTYVPKDVDGIKYLPIDNENCIVVGYTNCPESLKIPSNITITDRQYTVSSIGAAAFSSCEDMEEVTIPESMSFIDYCCFEQCTNLVTASLPQSLTRIGHSAFFRCYNLNKVICMATKPPILDINPYTGITVFSGVSLSAATLQVPTQSVNTYRAATTWSSFGTITRASNIIESIIFSTSTTELKLGESTTLEPIINPKDATDTELSWESSNTKVVTVDTNGTIYAIAEGEATVTVKVSDSNVSASCIVTVYQPVTEIVFNRLRGQVGGSITLDFACLPTNAKYQDLEWTSTDNNIATVDDHGVVAFVSPGEVQIVATNNSITHSTDIIIDPVNLKSIKLTPDTLYTSIDSNLLLLATPNPINAEIGTIEWSSENTSVATVDENGLVHAVGGGTSKITANANGHKYSCELIVSNNPSTAIQYICNNMKFTIGEGEIIVTNAPYGAAISVYSTDGIMLYGIRASADEMHIPVNSGEILILNIASPDVNSTIKFLSK